MPASRPCELQTLNRPASVSPSAFSSKTIVPGSILSAPATPETAGLLPLQQTAQNNQGYTEGMLGLSTLPQSRTNINTVQSSSTNAPWYTYIPSDILSAVEGLVNSAITPPGYTPGGAPLAGGSFPNNYPFTESSIKVIELVLLSLFGG